MREYKKNKPGHMYYIAGVFSLDAMRIDAQRRSKYQDVTIHHHTVNDQCNGRKHDFFKCRIKE